MDRVQDVGVAALHRGRLAGQVDRDLDADLLLQVDLVKVDVRRPVAARMHLDLADQDLLGLAVDQEVDEVGSAGLDEHPLELQAVQGQRRRRRVVAVHHGGQLALAVEAAGALAEQLAGGCVELHKCASG